MVKIWKVHIWKLQSFVLSGLDYVLIFVFFIFAQSSMKVDESITLFIFVSNYSCSIFALLWNVTTHNLIYFISMCSSMGLFFSFELNTQTFLMYLFQIKYPESLTWFRKEQWKVLCLFTSIVFEIFMFKHRLKFQCAKKRCKSGLMDHFQKNISWKVFYIWSLWTIILSKLSGGGGVVARNCSAPTFSAHVKLHVYASIEGNFNASLKHYHCCWHSWSSSPPWKKQMSRVICVLSIVFEILPCLHKSNSLQWKYRLRLIINHQQADCASLHLQTQKLDSALSECLIDGQAESR